MSVKSEINYFVLSEDDFEQVTDLLGREFFTREPLTQGIHAKNVQVKKGRVAFDVRKCLQSGVSVGARDSATGELVGVRISKVVAKTDTEDQSPPGNELTALYRVYDEVMAPVDLFKEGVTKALSMYMVGVHRDFGGRGIGKRLVELCMEKGVEKGCQLAVTCITNKLSGKIFEKLGYEVRHSLDLTSLSDDYQVDTSAMFGNTTIRVMTKRLP